MASDTTWESFFAGVKACHSCSSLGVINVLTDLHPSEAWGLPWYDRHRNLDGGLMVVGMDFGNEETVRDLRAACKRNPDFKPGEGQDKSYARLRRFLKAAAVDGDAYVTNAAMCVRQGGSQETGRLDERIYKNCTGHLRTQINLVKPYVVVALGKDALDFVCDALRTPRFPEGITKYAGQRRTVKVNGTEVILIPFIHPSRPQIRHGWSDERQIEELYHPLRQILDERMDNIPRVDYRQRFGVLN